MNETVNEGIPQNWRVCLRLRKTQASAAPASSRCLAWSVPFVFTARLVPPRQKKGAGGRDMHVWLLDALCHAGNFQGKPHALAVMAWHTVGRGASVCL